MVERLTSVRITVHVETNKATYRESFDSMEDAQAYYRGVMESL